MTFDDGFAVQVGKPFRPFVVDALFDQLLLNFFAHICKTLVRRGQQPQAGTDAGG